MSSIEAAVRALLVGAPAVATLVGQRIYPYALPQGATYPAIRYQRISTDRTYSIQARSDRAQVRMQVDCYAEALTDALALAAAVRDAIDVYSGTSAGVAVRSVTAAGESGGYESDPLPAVFRESIDFMVAFNE